MPEGEKPTESEDSSRQGASPTRVAPGWRTASLVLGSLATLLAALGPFTAWINGVQDRKLQQARVQGELTLQYMALLLGGIETAAEGEATLKLLNRVLRAQNPRDAMLDVVEEQLETIERMPLLEAEVAASDANYKKVEEELTSAEEQLAIAEASTAATAAELEAARKRSAELRQALDGERRRNVDLQQQLERARLATGVVSRTREDGLLEQLPDEEERLFRSLRGLCQAHGGSGAFQYFGPGKPGVSCSFGSASVRLVEASLDLKVSRLADPTAPYGTPIPRLEMCREFGAEPVPNSGSSMNLDEVLCRHGDTGRIIRVGSPLGY